MKNLTAALILGSCATATLMAQTEPADDTTFRKLQSDWATARKNQDVPFLERFYATEFTVGDINGAENSREQDIAMFRSKILKPAVITDTELVVHRYGEAALVTGVEHLEGTYAGNFGTFDLRFANTYVYRDGRWQMVRQQATGIRKH